jgi:hypothetical protein
MRVHKGIRPHDIVVLLKLCQTDNLKQKDLASTLFLSQAEISDSLNRSVFAGLIDEKKKYVMRQGLYEFIVYGLKYVVPVVPGNRMKGLATGHSASIMKNKITADIDYVWPDKDGDMMGLSIEPLYKNQLQAAKLDLQLYDALVAMDSLRLRNPREFDIAKKIIKEYIF